MSKTSKTYRLEIKIRVKGKGYHHNFERLRMYNGIKPCECLKYFFAADCTKIAKYELFMIYEHKIHPPRLFLKEMQYKNSNFKFTRVINLKAVEITLHTEKSCVITSAGRICLKLGIAFNTLVEVGCNFQAVKCIASIV